MFVTKSYHDLKLRLNIYLVPVSAVVGMDPNNNYVPGSTIAIGCSVQGYPKPNVTWIKDGLPLFASERIQISVGMYSMYGK